VILVMIAPEVATLRAEATMVNQTVSSNSVQSRNSFPWTFSRLLYRLRFEGQVKGHGHFLSLVAHVVTWKLVILFSFIQY